MVKRDAGFNRDLLGTTDSLLKRASGYMSTFALLVGFPLLLALSIFLDSLLISLFLGWVPIPPSTLMIMSLLSFLLSQIVMIYYLVEASIKIYASIRSGRQLGEQEIADETIEYYGSDWNLLCSIEIQVVEYLAKMTTSLGLLITWFLLIHIRLFRSIGSWLDGFISEVTISIDVSGFVSFLDYLTRVQLQKIARSLNPDEQFFLLLLIPTLLLSFAFLLNLRRFLVRMYIISYDSDKSMPQCSRNAISEFYNMSRLLLRSILENRDNTHIPTFLLSAFFATIVLVFYLMTTYWILTT